MQYTQWLVEGNQEKKGKVKFRFDQIHPKNNTGCGSILSPTG
jgi:hypothetical protein